MIPGFNTDVEYKNIVYHVQTEDKGLRNPKVETLVYRGGSILHAKTTSYNDILNTENRQELVQAIMEEQHAQILDDIRKGKFHSSAVGNDAKPFGFGMISEEKSLDEVIMEYLEKKMD